MPACVSPSRLILCLLLLTSCSSPEDEPRQPPRPFKTVVADTSTATVKGAIGVVAEPFEDVGLKRQPIPEPLAALIGDPYKIPPQPVCASVQQEMAVLDPLLGTSKEDDIHRKSFRDEGASIIENQALSMLRGQVQVLPFRGVVRRVSGAESLPTSFIREEATLPDFIKASIWSLNSVDNSFDPPCFGWCGAGARFFLLRAGCGIKFSLNESLVCHRTLMIFWHGALTTIKPTTI